MRPGKGLRPSRYNQQCTGGGAHEVSPYQCPESEAEPCQDQCSDGGDDVAEGMEKGEKLKLDFLSEEALRDGARGQRNERNAGHDHDRGEFRNSEEPRNGPRKANRNAEESDSEKDGHGIQLRNL